jgi:hypothetical protein
VRSFVNRPPNLIGHLALQLLPVTRHPFTHQMIVRIAGFLCLILADRHWVCPIVEPIEENLVGISSSSNVLQQQIVIRLLLEVQ